MTSPRRLLLGTGMVWLLAGASAMGQWVEDNWRTTAVARRSQSGDLFGWRVIGLDDSNGDGVADFAVSAPFHNTNRGRVSAFSGVDGSAIWQATSTTGSDILGFELQTIEDQDGDGLRDVITSAPWSGNGGRVHIYSSATGANLFTFAGTTGQSVGASIATGGDFDGDGVLDLALGDISSNSTAGRVFVYSGVNFSLLHSIDPPLATDTRFGTSIHFLGDIDGDQRDDLVIGLRLSGNDPPGRLEVYAENGGVVVHKYTIDAVNLSCVLCADMVDGGKDVDGDGVGDIYIGEDFLNQVRIFSGVDGSLIHTLIGDGIADNMGAGGGLIDDLNGDGLADILTSARFSSDGASNAGKVFVFSGADGSILHTITRTVADSRFGTDVDILGDLNGDGFPEFVVSLDRRAFVMTRCDASWHTFGTGWPGTTGVPSLSLSAPPVLGTGLNLDLQNSLGTATVGLLLLGFDTAELAATWGGTLWVSSFLATLLPVPATGLTLVGSIPADDTLCGQKLVMQVLQADPGASQGISSTAGLQAFLGR